METLPQCDYNIPVSVVKAFNFAMNRWETQTWQAMRAARSSDDPSSYQPEVKKKFDDIFAVFCTPKDRPYGRIGAFQNPPEYDPAKEQIQCSTIEKRKANVDTMRDAVLNGHSQAVNRLCRQLQSSSPPLRPSVSKSFQIHIM